MITGGLFEVGHGIRDPVAALRYWGAFGFRAGAVGRLDAVAAKKLYGVASALRSVRLQHLDADHGLIRLMQWERPGGEGLGMAPFRTLGARWVTTLTDDAYGILNHCELLRRSGAPIWIMEPVFSPSHYLGQDGFEPFGGPVPGLREGAFITPDARHVFLQRFGFTRPNYGRTNPDSLLKASQNIHAGLIMQDDSGAKRRFYSETLGLTCGPEATVTHEKALVSRSVVDLEPGEPQRVTDIDDIGPAANPIDGRSGRLKLFRFDDAKSISDLRDVSRPGSLGPSLYTWRARDLPALRDRVAAGGGNAVTPVLSDEFGSPAFSFVAPDGYFWTIVGV